MVLDFSGRIDPGEVHFGAKWDLEIIIDLNSCSPRDGKVCRPFVTMIVVFRRRRRLTMLGQRAARRLFPA